MLIPTVMVSSAALKTPLQIMVMVITTELKTQIKEALLTTVNTETGKYITLVAPSGSVISTVGTAAATVEDEGKSYPFGFLSFTVEGVPVGEVADLEAYFFTDNSKDGYSARKFHSLSQEYSDVEGAVIAEVDVGASKALKLTYSIQDGGEGDEDGEANGTIVDPVGLSINSSPTVATSPIETSSTQADILAKTGDSHHYASNRGRVNCSWS